MNFRVTTGLAALLCVAMASCYPYDESASKKKVTKKPQPTAAELAKKKEEEARKKAEEDLKKKAGTQTAEPTQPTAPDGATTTGSTAPDSNPVQPPAEPKRNEYVFATKVPGKDGFVFSPYNNKVVDVRDIPSGTLVQDPTYPPSEKKYFRVP